MVPPYKRNEADEMVKLFRKFINERKNISNLSKNWVLIAEAKSLSTLENIVNSKEIIKKHGIEGNKIVIFCEFTREKRVRGVAKYVFGESFNKKIIPVDFDSSEHRYLPPDYLKKKEDLETKHSLWALESSDNLKKHHDMFIEKMDFIRREGPKMKSDATRIWWEKKMKEYPGI